MWPCHKYCFSCQLLFVSGCKVNPRPDGVWLVVSNTSWWGGGGANSKYMPEVSQTAGSISKFQTPFDSSVCTQDWINYSRRWRPWGVLKQKGPNSLKGPKINHANMAMAEKQLKISKRAHFRYMMDPPGSPPENGINGARRWRSLPAPPPPRFLQSWLYVELPEQGKKKTTWRQGCNLRRNRVKLLSFSEQLIQSYLEGMRRTGTRLLEVRDFLRVKLDDLWLPVQKSSTSVRQRSGRCWHPARAATGCEQNGGNLTQLRHRLQPYLEVMSTSKSSTFRDTWAWRAKYRC